MTSPYQNMSLEELVDLLAQKTQKFTQLLVDKNFNDEYKESKETIQQIVSEIELRKGSSTNEEQPSRQTSVS